MISLLGAVLVVFSASAVAEDWPQIKYDSRHSGNLPARSIETPLGLVGAVAMTDAIFTSPAVCDDRVYVVDGSGVIFCMDAETLRVIWKRQTEGGAANCNNVSSPVIIGRYLHFGTTGGNYYVFDKENGALVNKIPVGEPIFSAPVVGKGRVYFTTLGSKVYAIDPDGGKVCWTWDFVKEKLGFEGDRWSGQEWAKHKQGRVTWHDQFLCSRDMAMYDNMLVIPAGGDLVWLEDTGEKPELRGLAIVPRYCGRENPATFGLTITEDGTVYREWHRRDNGGRVETHKLVNGDIVTDYIKTAITGPRMSRSLAFTAVTVRDGAVYRVRPEEGFGFCKHYLDQEQYMGGYPAICSPVLLKDNAVYGGLDGSINVVPLSGSRKVWSFKTAFGCAITAPLAVANGKIYAACEDGYLYVLGSEGKASLPTKDLELWKIRSPLKTKYTDPKYNWYTNYGNWSNSNVPLDQGLKPPFKVNWVRRYEGSIKHFSTCGDGRVYTHTAEGMVFAVEQETGRLLWRIYYPGIHVSYTAPLFYDGKLLVPQAGFEKCMLRYLDAATGKLIWESPFSGSPGWNRQLPPVIYKNLAIYMFAEGRYTADETEDTTNWLFYHGMNPSYPRHLKPKVRAWNFETGEEVWTRDFSEFGSGGDDTGICLVDGIIYYTTFFGHSVRTRRGFPGTNGITAAIEPETGQVLWVNAKYSTYGGCSISGADGRIYFGGYNSIGGTGKLGDKDDPGEHHIWCLDTKTGALLWQTKSIMGAAHVISIGKNYLHANDHHRHTYIIDKETGEILTTRIKQYRCTRFTLSEPYLLGDNMDVRDITDPDNTVLVSSGPQLDTIECIGTIVSNGRLFYTAHGGGLQASQVYGEEAENFMPKWSAAVE